MKLSKQQALILGLSETDLAILEALKGEPRGFTTLAQALKLPRTSLYLPVKNLIKRGLVTTLKIGRRQRYQAIETSNLHTTFSHLADLFSQTGVSNKQVILEGKISSQYLVYKGVENLIALYQKFGQLNKNSRVYAIQPNISAYSVMKSFPHQKLMEINRQIKERKIMIEGILQENFLAFYTTKLKEEGLPVRDIFRAYGGRLADTRYVSAEYLNFDSEIMMTDNFAVIANWQEMVAIEIRDREVVGILIQLFQLIKSLAKKVDQNPMVEKIINTQLGSEASK